MVLVTGDLNNPVGARALSVDDDSGFVVDEIVGVVSEKWIRGRPSTDPVLMIRMLLVGYVVPTSPKRPE